MESRIGATVGTTYCGVVGGVMRHEYAVLGPSVNLAARLMACKGNRGILVDENVRSLASDKFGFEALSPVVAKGYIDPVPIYEPLNPLERCWSRPKINFVGRCEEMAKLIDVARTMALAPSPTRMVVFTGESGMGKVRFARLLTSTMCLFYRRGSSRLSFKVDPTGAFRRKN